jgi:hypothetical protein
MSTVLNDPDGDGNTCEDVPEECYTHHAVTVLGGALALASTNASAQAEEDDCFLDPVGGLSGFLSLLAAAVGLLVTMVSSISKDANHGAKAQMFSDASASNHSDNPSLAAQRMPNDADC